MAEETRSPTEKKNDDPAVLLARIIEIERQLEGLEFPDDTTARIVSYVTGPTANAENAVDHNGKKVPRGFVVINKSAAVDVYRGANPWTASKLFLKATVANVTTSLLVIY